MTDAHLRDNGNRDVDGACTVLVERRRTNIAVANERRRTTLLTLSAIHDVTPGTLGGHKR